MKADFRTVSFFVLLSLVCGIALGVLRDKDVEEARLKVGERKLELVPAGNEVPLYSGYLRYEFVDLTPNGRLLVMAPSLQRSLQEKLKKEWKSATFYRDIPRSEGLISQKEFVEAFEVPEIHSGRTRRAWEDEEFKKELLLLCQKGRSLQQFYVYDRPDGKLLARVEVVIAPPLNIFPFKESFEGDLSEIVWPDTDDLVFRRTEYPILTNSTSHAIGTADFHLEKVKFDDEQSDSLEQGVFFKDEPAVTTGLDKLLKEIVYRELKGRVDAVPLQASQEAIVVPPFRSLTVKKVYWGKARFYEVSFPGLEREPIQLAQIEGSLVFSNGLVEAPK